MSLQDSDIILAKQLQNTCSPRSPRGIAIRNRLMSWLSEIYKLPSETLAEITGLKTPSVRRILSTETRVCKNDSALITDECLGEGVDVQMAISSATQILQSDKTLITIPYLRKALHERHNIVLSKKYCVKLVKEKLNLIWRKIYPVAQHVNTNKNKFLR